MRCGPRWTSHKGPLKVLRAGSACVGSDMETTTPDDNRTERTSGQAAGSTTIYRDDFERRRVQVRDVELTVREQGSGPALIWGHGLLTSMAQEDDVDVFDWWSSGAAMRWVRYDARGHGESAATHDPANYRWPALARDVLELATQLGEQRAVFGGVSMGCATSLHAAHVAPERVAGLLLVAPPTAWEKRPRQSRIYRVGAAIVGTVGLAPLRWMSGFSLPSRQDSIVTRVQQALVRHLATADERAVAAALAGAAQSDLPLAEDLARIDVPTLILAWRGDPIHPISTAERLAEVMPDAELVVARSLADIRGWPDRLHGLLERVNAGK